MEDRTPISIGPYRLGPVLGEGGMGTVYRAEQEQPFRRQVALKLIRPGLDTREVIARFEAEQQAVALMDHPNIAKVLDAGTTPTGQPYFVMEWVQGEAITHYCNTRKLTIDERLQIFMDVCRGIQHAHQKAIIHRDLKPSNILVTHRDGHHVPKVIDFGIAKALGAQSLTDKTMYTQFGQFVGTPQYVSPEQADTHAFDVDTRADVYSLGAILYELLTGVPPLDFDHLRQAGVLAIQKHILESEPLRPSARLEALRQTNSQAPVERHTSWEALHRRLKGDLDWVAMTAIHKDRDQRYGTANVLAHEIQRVLDSQPVQAGPPSVSYRLRKFTQRNRLLVGASAVVLATMFLGTIVSTWQAIRATQYANLAESRLITEREAVARANEATVVAQAARERSQQAFAQSDYQTGQQLAKQSQYAPALAYFARSLELEPYNPAASDRIYSILTQSDHCWQTTKPLPHAEPVYQVALSSDGGLICTATEAGTITLWRPVRPTEKLWSVDYEGTPSSLKFSPDDQSLLLGGFHGCRKLRVSDGTVLHSISEQEQENWLDFTFSEDGSQLLSSSWVQGAGLWDAESLEPIRHFDHRHLRTATFSHDESLILTTSQIQRDACLWRASDGTLLKRFQHSAELWYGWFSPDDSSILITTSEGKAFLWSIDNESTPQMVFDHKTSGVLRCAAFSPQSNLITTGSSDLTARVWDITTGNQVSLLKGRSEFNAVGFLPNDRLFTVETAGRIRTWQLQNGQAIPQTSIDVNGLIHDVAWAPKLDQLAIAGDAEVQARVYKLSSQCPSVLFPLANVTCSTLNCDGSRVLFGTGQGQIVVMTIDQGETEDQFTHHTAITALARHPTKPDELSAGSDDGTLLQWTIGEKRPQALKLAGKSIRSISYSPDGKTIAAATEGTVHLVATETNNPSLSLPQVGKVTALTFAPNGRLLLIGSSTGIAHIWDLTETKEVCTLRHRGLLQAATWSPDSTMVATATTDAVGMGDRTIHFWSSKDGSALGDPLRHAGTIHALEFSHDGQQLLSVSAANGVALWKTQSRERQTLLEESRRIHHATFSPNGKRLAILAEDSGARYVTIYATDSGDPLSERLMVDGLANTLQFTPDSRRIMASPRGAADDENVVRLWPITIDQDTPDLPHDFPSLIYSLGGLAFDSEGKLKPIEPLETHFSNIDQSPLKSFAHWLCTPTFERSSHPLAKTPPPYRYALAAQIGRPFHRELERLNHTSPVLMAKDSILRAALTSPEQTRERRQCSHAMKLARQLAPDDITIQLLEGILLELIGERVRGFGICYRSARDKRMTLPILLETLELCEKAGVDYPIKSQLFAQALSKRDELTETEYWTLRHRYLLLNIKTAFFDNALLDWQDLAGYPGWIETKATMALADQLLAAAETRSRVEEGNDNMIEANRLQTLSTVYRQFRQSLQPRANDHFIQTAIASLTETDLSEALSTLQSLVQGLPESHPLHYLQPCYQIESTAMPLPVADHLSLWTARAQIQVALARSFDRSCAPLATYLDQLPDLVWPSDPLTFPSLVEHAKLLEAAFKSQGREDRATETRRWLSSPPTRAPNTHPHQVDLTSYYNASLYEVESWHGDPAFTLATLPNTLLAWKPNVYDARGILQLAGAHTSRASNGQTYPSEVYHITVARTTPRLHFLMGILNGQSSIGRSVIKAVFHYADGSEETVSIRYGQPVVDWKSTWVPSPDQSLFVPTSPGVAIQLTQVVLENPRPNTRINFIDLQSTKIQAAPFILAITSEKH